MSIGFKMKGHGIKVVKKLEAFEVNTIAMSIVNKLCSAFPEHGFDRSKLFELISRLNMYTAKMPEDLSGAKYVFRKKSIYFNELLDTDEKANLAVHECIHCIQHAYTPDRSMRYIGLQDISTNYGLGLNEASVQLMASEANQNKAQEETYYGISIKTISPDYYPLECTLANELVYFTGTYPLYNSTLFTNDIFKNTFILKTSQKTYNKLIVNFDKLVYLENNLNYFINELQGADKAKTIKSLTNLINRHKIEITNTFFKTQNLIIDKCFKSEFNNIRNLEDITRFNKKIYNFKNIMGYSDNYTFYNEFYRKIMRLVQIKKESIEKYGQINLYEELNKKLTIVEANKNLLYFINKFATKVKKLVKLNRGTEDNINNL